MIPLIHTLDLVLHLLHLGLKRLVLPLIFPRQFFFYALELVQLVVSVLNLLVELFYQAVIVLTASEG